MPRNEIKRRRGETARQTLARLGIDARADFFTLSSDEKERLVHEADVAGYRKPRNANGSRARYFHAKLVRESKW